MNKIKRKIISGAVIFGGAIITLGAISKLNEKSENAAVPVALLSYENEKPIIVLDAGHGE
ncbi:MAG: hypothetical protein J6A30_05360 [Ruminococcus sp.]|nr:hypothetical protein [Ruminococcus sp.]